MTKFLRGWEDYRIQMEAMDMSTRRTVKQSIMDPKLDGIMADKLTQEQQDTLGEFKQIIY